MQCSEICGVSHGYVPVVIKIVSVQDILIWLNGFNANILDLFNSSIFLKASVGKKVSLKSKNSNSSAHSDATVAGSTKGASSIANPISTDNLDNKPSVLNPMWVTGFTDAEGSFHSSVYKKSANNKWSVIPRFEITLHYKDLNILQEIKDYFGVGSIYIKKTNNLVSFIVSKNSDLMNVIIPRSGSD